MTSPENPLKTRMSIPVKSIMKIDLRRPPAPSRPAVGNQGLRSQEAGSQGGGSQESGGLSAQRGIADSRSRECSPPPRRQPPCPLTLYPLTSPPLTTSHHPPKGPKPCPRPS